MIGPDSCGVDVAFMISDYHKKEYSEKVMGRRSAKRGLGGVENVLYAELGGKSPA